MGISKHNKYVAACAAAFIISGTANAQDSSGPVEAEWYVSGFVGAAFPGDLEVDALDISFAELDLNSEANIGFSNDVYFGGAVGRKLGFKFFDIVQPRIEAEVSYFSTNVNEIEGFEGFELDLGGIDGFTEDEVVGLADSIDVLFVLANSYSDFIWREDQAVIPYIGGGLGVAITGNFGDDTSANFAGTTTIGATVPVGQFDFFTEGRYFRIYSSGPDFDGFTAAAGLRWRF